MKKKSKHTLFAQIGENISRLMEAHGVDATTLARKIGLPASTISRLRSKAVDANPNLASLMPIAEFFHVTLSQLIGETPVDLEHPEIMLHQLPQKSLVPLLKTEEIMPYLEGQSPEYLHLTIDFSVGNKTFAYILQGNAMEPQFPDKTLLIVDPAIHPENLDYVVLLQAEKKLPIFRQLFIENEEKYIKTLNPLFNEFNQLTVRDTILGVMVQARQNFKTTDTVSYANVLPITRAS